VRLNQEEKTKNTHPRTFESRHDVPRTRKIQTACLQASAQTPSPPQRAVDQNKAPSPPHDAGQKAGEMQSKKQKDGLAGNRTLDHSHAKGVLYH
jgi:hypothetical protein